MKLIFLNYYITIVNNGDEMDFLRQTDVIQWVDGEYKTIKENSVDDEYTYLFID